MTFLIHLVLVSSGAICGSCIRWGLGHFLNRLTPAVPSGTLLANLLGCYLIGLVVPIYILDASGTCGMSENERLFILVGFLGSLTTFSSFTAETMELLFTSRYLLGLWTILLHVIGSLAMTALGIITTRYVRSLL